jgi:hypothetical protein
MSATEKMASGPTTPERDELYRQWLGVRYSHPSYYGLLGLAELEPDEEVIQQAGRKAKRTLRAYQIGTYRAEALDLLQEIGQAVSVLVNAEKRREYDRDLRVRWTAAVRELYAALCEGDRRDAAMLEAWLKTCADRGVPVTRLLPSIIRGMGEHLEEWPPHGNHALPMPVNLWIYRDAVILGQGLKDVPLDRRASAVQHIQKVLGLSEGLARLVAEEITRDAPAFDRLRMLVRARRDPMGLLVSLGARVRRYGGQLGRTGKVVVAAASMLGVKRRDMTDAVERLTLTRRPVAAAPAAPGPPRPDVARNVHVAARRLRDAVAERPRGLVIALAVLVGLAALAFIVAVATNTWSPWAKTDLVPVETPTAVSKPAVPPAPGKVDVEAIQKFRNEHPEYNVRPGETGTRPEEPKAPASVEPDESPATAPAPATKFFNVPSTPAPPKPPKKKP